jgi:hypothetical protein
LILQTEPWLGFRRGAGGWCAGMNGCTFYTKTKDSRSLCQNSGVRVDVEDSMRQKMLIMATLKKHEN